MAFATPVTAQTEVLVANGLATGETLLEVAAEGRASAAPDRAGIQGGVTTNDPTAHGAVTANATAMNAVIAALQRAGLAERDIRTARVTLQPQHDVDERGRRQPTISSYTATNSVAITVRDLSKLSDYLSVMFEAGANTVSGPIFRVDDDAALMEQARADAVARARAEAETYAAAFGMRIVRVVRINERGRRQETGEAIVVSARQSGMAASGSYASVPTTTVLVGQVEQVANLWVDFALVPR